MGLFDGKRCPRDLIAADSIQMTRHILSFLALVAIAAGCSRHADDAASGQAAPALRINGSTTVNLPVAEAAEILRERTGRPILVDTQGGSSGGIAMLAEGLVDLGMISKPVGDSDRAKFPGVDFRQIHIGEDAVAMVVSRDVWEGGVRSLNRGQLAAIYEGRVVNWSQLGGPDRRIAFFNKEPGRGTWEVFAKWVYGSAKDAPQASFPEVGGNEETRNKVASTRGALSQLSASWADGQSVFALALVTDSGERIEPTGPNIANHAYPMSRPLFLLSAGAAAGPARELVDFILSPEGQGIVRKHGYLALADLVE